MQAPFRQLTPQNQNTVEVVFRPPREANILFAMLRCKSGASLCSLDILIHALETTGVSLGELLEQHAGTAKAYKISQMKQCFSPFFGRTPDRQAHLIRGFHAPIAVRIADAIAWLNFSTSVACSASTITRAKGSVPE